MILPRICAALNGNLQKKMLRVAVPNGLESGIFQLIKVALVFAIGNYLGYVSGLVDSRHNFYPAAKVREMEKLSGNLSRKRNAAQSSQEECNEKRAITILLAAVSKSKKITTKC